MKYYTSAELNKMLRKLKEESELLLKEEKRCQVFNAALGEELDSVRPVYDYGATRNKLDELDNRIRAIKHALNEFNVQTVLPDTDMTIDQVLVYLPQLAKRKAKLYSMQNRLPKQRENVSGFNRNSSVIDYSYINYNLDEVRNDYQNVANEISELQLKLDMANTTLQIEIPD